MRSDAKREARMGPCERNERTVRGCGFCEIAERGLQAHGLYEDEFAFVILDRDSRGFGHCMVIARRHVREELR